MDTLKIYPALNLSETVSGKWSMVIVKLSFTLLLFKAWLCVVVEAKHEYELHLLLTTHHSLL
jgi:hypothetical protein